MGTIQNGTDLVDATYAAFGGVDATDRSYAARVWTQTLRAATPADLATTAGGTIVLGAPRIPTYPFGGGAVSARYRVVGGRVTFSGAITASDAANAVFTVFHYTPAGASATGMLTISTATTGTGGTGTVAVGMVVPMTLTPANASLVADGTLVLIITKAGAGVTVPAGTVVEVDVVPVS